MEDTLGRAAAERVEKAAMARGRHRDEVGIASLFQDRLVDRPAHEAHIEQVTGRADDLQRLLADVDDLRSDDERVEKAGEGVERP